MFGMAFALPSAVAQEPASARAQQQTPGINLTNMDRSVKPGDNFYEFANGGWINRTEIAPDKARI
ncbi:MAG TPA: hypothetical protein VF783_06730, partial [Terriglobales bacterium]